MVNDCVRPIVRMKVRHHSVNAKMAESLAGDEVTEVTEVSKIPHGEEKYMTDIYIYPLWPSKLRGDGVVTEW